jgi:hypothetical protein
LHTLKALDSAMLRDWRAVFLTEDFDATAPTRVETRSPGPAKTALAGVWSFGGTGEP